jgi:hypothetical protein
MAACSWVVLLAMGWCVALPQGHAQAQQTRSSGQEKTCKSKPGYLCFQCVSADGRVFIGKNGYTCRKGELLYINVAFDSERAGLLVDEFCDPQKDPPPEAMDVYGVLCYLRIDASSSRK